MRLHEFSHNVDFKIQEYAFGFRIHVLSDLEIDREALPELYQKIFKYPNQIGIIDLGADLKDYPNVETVFLAKEARRQGLGTKVYNKAMEYAKEKLGAKGISSDRGNRNINSDAFWKKFKQGSKGRYDVRHDAFEGFLGEDELPRDKMEVAVDILTKAFIRRGSSIHAYVKDEGKTSMTELCEALGNKFFIKLVSFKDIDLFNKYGKLYNNFNWQNAFKMESEMSGINDLMRMPEYFEKEKGVSFKVVKMSPYAYQLATNSGFRDDTFTAQDNLVWEYALKALEGSPMPLPTLEYSENNFTQEGRHRAAAANLLGIPEIPVIVTVTCRKGCPEFKERIFNRYK